MHIEHLWLTDFRSYTEAELEPAPAGITVVTGGNGAGKTNLIEAIGYLATLKSLRGSPADALVRADAAGGVAIVRAAVGRAETGRKVMVEAELHAAGRDRVKVGGQPLRRARDLLGVLQVTVFSPDDLALVKGGPTGRRDYLDDLLVARQPRLDLLLAELDRVLRQRNALLKSAFSSGGWRPGRPLPEDISVTLDVWDAKLSSAGEELAEARAGLVEALRPLVEEVYAALAEGSAQAGRRRVGMAYRRSWVATLADAVAAARGDDLRRGVTTVGPQRDDLHLEVGGLPARTHASQGEQRTLALALRLAGHRLLTEALDSAPVLLLDDVFSELDAARSEALLRSLPDSQAILTTAGEPPAEAGGGEGNAAASRVAARFRVEDGKILR